MSNKKKKKTGVRKRKTNTSKNNKEQEKKSKNQLGAILLFVFGVLVFAICVIKGQSLWKFVHNTIYGLFGPTALLLSPILIYISILSSKCDGYGTIKHKFWQSGLLISVICGAVQIFNVGEIVGENFADKIVKLFELGVDFKGGGVVGAIFGWPLISAAGKTGASVIIVLLIFLALMLVTGSTLIGFFNTLYKPVKKLEESYIYRQQEKKAQFDIDVDLGPDALPSHPVSSNKRSKIDIQIDEVKLNEQINADKLDNSVIEDAKNENQEKSEIIIDDLVNKATKIEDNSKPKNENQEKIKIAEILVDEIEDDYIYPNVNLLKQAKLNKSNDVSDELKDNAQKLVDTLKSFGVNTKIIDICRGPTVTRYELQPSAGVKISKITGLADDIALNLAAAGVRIEAPIPNKPAVGIEVPNKKVDMVSMKEIIDSSTFEKAKSKLSVALGKDISGNITVADLAKMPHVLIAGATGSGKSVCINSLIVSLLYKSTPDEVRLLMIDPKVVELGIYNGIPHLLIPVVTDPKKAAGALSWAVTEMLQRYKTFADNNARDLAGYNRIARNSEDLKPLPQIVIIIDELADLMMAAPNEVEDAICRLAQMARAAGMHLVIATQRPSVDVITGVIKANIPSRVAFAVSSQVDSRTILDSGGAEKLLGRGDMLFYPVGSSKPTRVQGCFVSDEEVEQIVSFIKNKDNVEYDENVLEEIEKQVANQKGNESNSQSGEEQINDELLPSAVEYVLEAGQASASLLQRRLKIGYMRAARLIDAMEERGIIGPFEGSKPRQVIINRQQWHEMNLNNNDN